MAHTEIVIDATPEQVFEVLADPYAYEDWVVGSDTIRGADAGFPAPGTRFYHRVGFGPLKISDHTEVVDANPPYRLELKAKTRPLGTQHVVLLLEPKSATSTRVTMIEHAGDPVTRLVFNPLTHLLLHGRNVESLRRLKRLAEERARARPRTMAAAGAGR